MSTDPFAPRPFLFALRHFLSPRSPATRPRLHRPTHPLSHPAHPFVLLVSVAAFLRGPLALPCILAWLGFGHDCSPLSDQAVDQARQRFVADRNFHSWGVWESARTAGFGLLLRVKGGLRLPVLERFADGSCRSRVRPRQGTHKATRAIPVRVIGCRITVGAKTSTYRLLTSLLDPTEAPARELVDVYARRWEVETAFAEFKGQLAERTTHVRAHRPAGVMAEVDALLIGSVVVRRLALTSARKGKVDPLTLSFRQAVEAVVCAMSRATGSDATLYRAMARRPKRRRTRSCPRVRKVVRCAWPVKTPGDHTFRDVSPPV
jgi:hypothetical protein